jgi:tetratricopeptide (TPR) repeat protein
MGHLNDAEPLLRKAIEIFFRPGERHSDSTKPLNVLALVLMERHRFEEAEMLLLRALALDEEMGDQSSVAVDQHNLALLLSSMGRTAEAEPVIRRSLEISCDVYGDGHPRTARKMQILAGILRDLGRPDEAEPLARQALEIFEGILGPDQPQTQSARKDLDTLTAA